MAHVATLTIDHTKVAADLTDFPVAVIANGDAGWAELYAVATESGGDIRVFKSDDVTELPREIVSFTVIGETGEIHIKYSGTLSGTVDTDIHIYADGTSADYAVTATYGRNNVWTGYRAVWHLNETSGNRTDSTSGGYTLTDNNSVLSVTGKLGNAANFVKANSEYLNSTNSGVQVTGNLVISQWVKPTAIGGARHLLWNTYAFGASTGLITALEKDGSLLSPRFAIYGGTNKDLNWIGDVNFSANTDQLMVFKYTASAGTVDLDLNGVARTQKTGYATSIPSRTGAAYGIDGNFGTDYYNGSLDEFRLKAGTQTTTWSLTEYNNQNSPSTFYSVAVAGGAIEQALTATAQASALVVKQMNKDITATAQAVASFTRQVGRAITATAQATASFVRQLGRTLSVTAQGSPTLQAGLLYVTELIATAQATASITYTQVTIVALTVTAQASTAITQIYARVRALTATASATASVVKNSTLARTLTATASATASVVQSGLIISRELIVTASATVTMTALKTLSYVMSVTVGSVVSLLKDYGYIDKYPENDATYEDKYPIE